MSETDRAIWLTPVHTGNAEATTGAAQGKPAHPRAYGERLHLLVDRVAAYGSPPRIRGTQPAVVRAGNLLRLTPVHTGNATARPKTVDGLTAHPRVYGERT